MINRGEQRGSALAVVLLVIVPMAVLSALMMTTVSSVTEHVEFQETDQRLAASASTTLDLTMVDVWRDYRAAAPGPLMGDLRDHLDLRGFQDGSLMLSDAGLASGIIEPGTEGLLDVFAEFGVGANAGGSAAMGDATLHDLRFERSDHAFWTIFTASASVGFGPRADSGDRKRADHMYFVEGLRFDDFDYAMLSNSIGCFLCHAHIDTTDNVYGSSDGPGLYTADGAKVEAKIGVLGEIRIREDEAASILRGKLYLLGEAFDANGGSIDWSTVDLERAQYDDLLTADVVNQFTTADIQSMTEQVAEWQHNDRDDGLTGDVTFSDASTATSAGTGELSGGVLGGSGSSGGATGGSGGSTGGALGGGGGQSGGEGGEVIELPISAQIPPAFPDDNGNRVIDPDEYDRLAAEADGAISGGAKVGVDHGLTYGYETMPVSDAEGTITDTFDGHLVLSGTAGDPIVIDGRVVVDGDVVISGFVKGEGEIVARGNVYMPGPVVYADGLEAGARTYGTADDGTTNRAAFVAGGSILVGDWVPGPPNGLTPVTGLPGAGASGGLGGLLESERKDESGGAPAITPEFAWNFTICQMMIFNREEWTRTQPTLPGPQGSTVTNPLYDPDYVPRYYRLNDSSDIYVFSGAATWFDPVAGTWVGQEYPNGWEENSYVTLSSAHLAAVSAVVNGLMPANDWIASEKIKSIAVGLSAPHAGAPLEVDGLMYSGNALFFAVLPDTAYLGQAMINGSVIVTHAGLLAPGPESDPEGVGFRLNFDSRQRKGIVVHDNSKLVFRRGVRIR